MKILFCSYSAYFFGSRFASAINFLETILLGFFSVMTTNGRHRHLFFVLYWRHNNTHITQFNTDTKKTFTNQISLKDKDRVKFHFTILFAFIWWILFSIFIPLYQCSVTWAKQNRNNKWCNNSRKYLSIQKLLNHPSFPFLRVLSSFAPRSFASCHFPPFKFVCKKAPPPPPKSQSSPLS